MATRTSSYSGDPFAELGVPPTASHDEVRRAFRRRAQETHPDLRPDDPKAAQRFARLRAAYEEALERIKNGEREEREAPRWGFRGYAHRAAGAGGGDKPRRKVLTEHELVAHIEALRDQMTLRRMMARHGHRPMIALALARNPSFPADAIPALRSSTDYHWTVEAAVAGRADLSSDQLFDVAQRAREPVVGLAVTGNDKATSDTLDALVRGPVRLDPALENALASHPDLSTAAATRLAARHATQADAVIRLIDRGDLPEDLVRRLAGQGARPLIAAAARRDLLRRGITPPPLRGPQRSTKTLTGMWR